MPIKDRIVAEVTKTWPEQPGSDGRLISQKFEDVVAENKRRGFKLESWQMQSVYSSAAGGGVGETIVAVFTKENE